jgi:hypothetical protein
MNGHLSKLLSSAELEREKFLRSMTVLEKRGVVLKFTPSSNNASSFVQQRTTARQEPAATAPYPSYDGSVLQRVCDDCACALQQRSQHYSTVKVFELCGWDIQTLRVLGQVCRKWHRASIMCLSTFRQIQYYLPSHPLSENEKRLLLRNRAYLGGHSKWLLQLVKAVDFSKEHLSSGDGDDDEKHDVQTSILHFMTQPRKHNCMLTMCSRLCRHELECVDALEILSNQLIQNVKLRNLSVGVLTRKASPDEWLSFLPVLLHSLSIETTTSLLGQAIVHQALADIRFCSDLYWGLSVLAEDRRCRRQFDGVRQRLLLTLEDTEKRIDTEQDCTITKNTFYSATKKMAHQLLEGQEFIDILWKLPHRETDRRVIGTNLKREIEKSQRLFSQPLRLPVDPLVSITAVDYDSIKVMRSAEAPLILTCMGADRMSIVATKSFRRREKKEVEDVPTPASSSFPSSSSSSSSSSSLSSSSMLTMSRKTKEQEDQDTVNHVPSQHATVTNKTNALNMHTNVTHPMMNQQYRLMYKRDDLRKDAIVQNIIHVMYSILKRETKDFNISLVTYRVIPTSSYDGLIEIVENAHTLYSIIRDHGNILHFLHHYNGHRV